MLLSSAAELKMSEEKHGGFRYGLVGTNSAAKFDRDKKYQGKYF